MYFFNYLNICKILIQSYFQFSVETLNPPFLQYADGQIPGLYSTFFYCFFFTLSMKLTMLGKHSHVPEIKMDSFSDH